MKNLSAVLLLLVALASWQTASAVKDCYYYDAAADFEPWQEHDLSKIECVGVANGRPGTCVHNSVCFEDDQGENVRTNPQDFCRKELGNSESALCCGIQQNCTATPSLLGSGTSPRNGACVSAIYCSNAVSMPGTGECAKSPDQSCCTEQEPDSVPVACSKRFSRIFERVTNVNNNVKCSDGELCFTNERLTNFLPYAMEKFDFLRDDRECPPIGDCAAATYVAFFYHMLVDFTRLNPQTVLKQIIDTVSDAKSTAGDAIEAELRLPKNAGHMTPEAFGDMLRILWEDPTLDLLQYNQGTCADWIRLADAVRGQGNHNWRCDSRWKALMILNFCRATTETNLGDCDGGAGVCVLNGEDNDADVCSSVGLEAQGGGSSGSCEMHYGSQAVCCAKKMVTSTKMTFEHNEYHNIRIAIDPEVEESQAVIDLIEQKFTKASEMLYEATGQRAVMKSFRIILPDSWSSNLAEAPRTDEVISDAEFTVMPDISFEDDGMSPNRVTMNTVQLGYCGSRGLGTTLTLADMEGQLGPVNIVKHFGFNRYGIFKEYPQNEFEMLPLDALNNPPPRCVEDNSTVYIYCNDTLDIQVDSSSTVTGSIAWLPDYRTAANVDHIIHFCDGRGCDPTRSHNEAIDNIHNRVCNKKATLDVILSNEDFDGVGTPPRPGISPLPTFTTVHRHFGESSPSPDAISKRMVLLMDVSGSMIGVKIENEKRAAMQLVDLLDPTIELGIVTFNSNARTVAPLTRGNDAGKATLKSAIAGIAASGNTCSGKGLDMAVDLLKGSGHQGGHIVFLTDGGNEDGDFSCTYTYSLRYILQQAATVHSIAVITTEHVNGDLYELASDTGGRSFMVSDPENMEQFVDQLESILIFLTRDDVKERVNVQTETVTVRSSGDTAVSIYLDNGLESDVFVSVLYDSSMLGSMSGTLSPPSGSDVGCSDESRYGKLNCQLTTKPTEGTWTLRLRSGSSSGLATVSVTATIEAAKTFSVSGLLGKPTLSLDPPENYWQKTELDKAQPLVGKVSFGRMAVIDAEVRVVITYEDGRTWEQSLSDDGEAYELLKGADLHQSDGVYSGAFQKINETGMYSVDIEVTGNSDSFYTRDVLLGVPRSEKLLAETINFRLPAVFKRRLSIGMFQVTKSATTARIRRDTTSTPILEQIPGKTSLGLIDSSADMKDAVFNFQWLAVGGQGYIDGHPSYYLLNVSTNALEVQDRADEIEVARSVDGRLSKYEKINADSSQVVGSPLTASIRLPLNQWRIDTRVYFTVTAYNYDAAWDESVAGPYSNIIIASVPTPLYGVCSSDSFGHCEDILPIDQPPKGDESGTPPPQATTTLAGEETTTRAGEETTTQAGNNLAASLALLLIAVFFTCIPV